MIVVDTSAIVAVLFGEPDGEEFQRKLLAEHCVISAATLVELGILIEAKTGPGGSQLLEELLGRIEIETAPLDAELAEEAMVCWRRLGQPLLFVGNDFAQTDVAVA